LIAGAIVLQLWRVDWKESLIREWCRLSDHFTLHGFPVAIADWFADGTPMNCAIASVRFRVRLETRAAQAFSSEADGERRWTLVLIDAWLTEFSNFLTNILVAFTFIVFAPFLAFSILVHFVRFAFQET
jgi:hypothetical protein